MRKPKARRDLSGAVFGRLIVKDRAPDGARNRTRWNCTCSCGSTLAIDAASLLRGASNSCGCAPHNIKTHGEARGGRSTPTHTTWRNMVNRCTNPRTPNYKHYGGRGISVDAAWYDYLKFKADMGERPQGTTLDRKDNDKPYSKDNCRWATHAEQAINRRSTIYVDYEGRTQKLAELAKAHGLPPCMAGTRHRLGWSVDRILNQKPIPRKKNVSAK